ncbi:CoA-transferase subunit beta [Chloroflexota bacterium]
MLACKPLEIMAIMAARMVQDGDVVFCGTGLSLIVAAVAKKFRPRKASSSLKPVALMRHSRSYQETGGVDAALPELPISVADSRVMYGTSMNAGLLESFSILGHRKVHTKAFLGAAQIDRFGNLNSTSIGDYWHPSVRLSGSGGAGDAACLAAEVTIFMQHEKNRFVPKLDYLTSPGWLSGNETRRKAGLHRGGPQTVVTDLGVMRFHEKTREIYPHEYYPGVTPQQIQKSTGFEIEVTRAVQSRPVTAEELRALREEVDPQKLII